MCRACCLIRARETTVKSMRDHPSERRAASAPTKSRYAHNCTLFPKGNRSSASPAHLRKTTHTFFFFGGLGGSGTTSCSRCCCCGCCGCFGTTSPSRRRARDCLPDGRHGQRFRGQLGVRRRLPQEARGHAMSGGSGAIRSASPTASWAGSTWPPCARLPVPLGRPSWTGGRAPGPSARSRSRPPGDPGASSAPAPLAALAN